MKEQRKQRLKKALWALALGICTFLYDYAFLLPYFVQDCDMRAMHVFGELYWYASAIVPIILVPVILHIAADYSARDWKSLLLTALVQLLMLPLLYYYVVNYDGMAADLLTFLALGWCMLYRIVTVFFLQIIVSLIPLAFGNRW